MNFEQSKKVGANRSFGIEGMKERIDLINGMIDINSVHNKGTFVKIEVPLK